MDSRQTREARASFRAAFWLATFTVLYCAIMGGCAHSDAIGDLLSGVCKVAVYALQRHNTALDSGVQE